MREINVLFGFKNKKTEDSITKELQALGCSVNGAMRYRKHMIREYIKEHPELDAVVLKEYLDGGERYGTQELCELRDDANVNVIVVLRSGHRGHDMMRELYHAGIVNAYFASGSRGARPEKLAELILHPRTRREAREYYRIEEKPLHREILAHEEFRDCFSFLTNEAEGIHIMDRFTAVSRWLTPQQMGIFVTTLPEEVKDVLKQYTEYYKIHAQLYKRRYVREPLRMPKEAKQALSAQVLTQALTTENERAPSDDAVKITPVTIRMVNHMPVEEEEHADENEHIRKQEISPARKYKGRKKESVDEDIYEVADRTQGREVKPLFALIEAFNGKQWKKKKGKKGEEMSAQEDTDENVHTLAAEEIEEREEAYQAERGLEKRAEEHAEMAAWK